MRMITTIIVTMIIGIHRACPTLLACLGATVGSPAQYDEPPRSEQPRMGATRQSGSAQFSTRRMRPTACQQLTACFFFFFFFTNSSPFVFLRTSIKYFVAAHKKQLKTRPVPQSSLRPFQPLGKAVVAEVEKILAYSEDSTFVVEYLGQCSLESVLNRTSEPVLMLIVVQYGLHPTVSPKPSVCVPAYAASRVEGRAFRTCEVFSPSSSK